MELFNLAQAELLRSNADRRHPFLYFTLATFGRYPEARTVVNRHVNAGLSVLLFTDRRTSKVSQARESPRVTALFYHPKKKLQVRMNGVTGNFDYVAADEDFGPAPDDEGWGNEPANAPANEAANQPAGNG